MTAVDGFGFDRDEVAATVTRIRRAQGLPDRVTDTSVIAATAARVNTAASSVTGVGKAPAAGGTGVADLTQQDAVGGLAPVVPTAS